MASAAAITAGVMANCSSRWSATVSVSNPTPRPGGPAPATGRRRRRVPVNPPGGALACTPKRKGLRRGRAATSGPWRHRTGAGGLSTELDGGSTGRARPTVSPCPTTSSTSPSPRSPTPAPPAPCIAAATGPAVIVMAEIPGITPTVADFARRVARPRLHRRAAGAVRRARRRPAALWPSLAPSLRPASRRSSPRSPPSARAPVTDWLRALARDAHESCGGPGRRRGRHVLHRRVRAGHDRRRATSRPGARPSRRCPSASPRRPRSRSQLSDADLDEVEGRVRPTGSACSACASPATWPCPPSASSGCAASSATASSGVEIDSSKGNPWGIPGEAHSVLTEELVDEPGHPTHDALDQVLELFRSRLLVAG